MARGLAGETCAEAIQQVLPKGEIVTATTLFHRIREKGDWKDDTIWQHLIAFVVNLPAARYHWKSARPFLFLHADGRYEIYDPIRHPHVQS